MKFVNRGAAYINLIEIVTLDETFQEELDITFEIVEGIHWRREVAQTVVLHETVS